MYWHRPIPYSPLFFLFNSNQWGGEGGGGWALVSLSYANDSGAARICQRDPKRWNEATERRGRGFSLSHGREIFENSCMKMAFSTLNAIIIGVIYVLA